MDQIRARAKQSLPTAPASAPPATTAPRPFYKMPVVWVGVAAVGFYFMTKKKGA